MEKSIDEIIADAQAEEEVEREQEKARAKKKIADDFKAELKKSVKAMLDEIYEEKEQLVKVPLSEYISLVFMARDLDLFKRAISNNFELSYNGKDLVIRDSTEIEETFKSLYPEEYSDVAALKIIKADDASEG